MTPLAPPKYRTIVADPPWDVKAGPVWASNGRSRDLVYPTMSVEEIVALPVRDLSNNFDQDAHLYLWTINAYLRDAFDVARAWGFHHSATICWCKEPLGSGLGGTWATNVEFVLFCRRPKLTTRLDAVEVTSWVGEHAKAAGISEDDIHAHMGTRRMAMWWVSSNPRMAAVPRWDQWERLRELVGFGDEMDERVRAINAAKGTTYKGRGERSVTSWFTWQRGVHSKKPEAFLDLVEQVSPGPYLELFARRQRLGWDTWGNEALNHVELAS